MLTTFFIMALIVAVATSIRLTGTWASPIVHFSTRWLFLIALYEFRLIRYNDISYSTQVAVAASALSFMLAAAIPMLAIQSSRAPNSILGTLRSQIDVTRLDWAIAALFVAGAAVFCYYLINAQMRFGWGFLTSGQIIRLAHSRGDITPGFHYLYAMEMIPPLCAFRLSIFHGSRRFSLLVALLAFSSLFFTTGRTNIAKSVVWIAAILLHLYMYRWTSWQIVKGVTLIGVLGLTIFFAIGGWTSEGYENSVLYREPELHGSIGALGLPYYYLSVQLPVLDALLRDPAVELQYGKLTLLPILKVVAVLDPTITVPSHIGEFYNTPLPANVATYLDVMYKDFGYFGMMILPAVLGFASSWIWCRVYFGPATLSIFLLNSLLFLTVFASTSSANYLKPSYWFQALVLIAVARFVRPLKGRRPNPGAPAPTRSRKSLHEAGDA